MTLLICWAANWKICVGKTGLGVENILAAVIERIPPPKGNVDEPLQALIFDSTIHFVELKCDKRRNWAKRLSLWLLVMNISQMKLDFKTKSSTEKSYFHWRWLFNFRN
jgi:hypothetical protein